MSKIGFIGLGIMGRPMAGHLQAAGHQLFLARHRSPLPQELLDDGATECSDFREIAQQADIIIVMVSDTPDVESVLFKANGVAAGLSAGKLVIDMSSISPIETRQYAARINELGCDYLDAPVSGGEVGAKNATLTIMVGGSDEAFARARPLFEKMGQNITLVGDNGAGQTCKVANQIVVALTIEKFVIGRRDIGKNACRRLEAPRVWWVTATAPGRAHLGGRRRPWAIRVIQERELPSPCPT